MQKRHFLAALAALVFPCRVLADSDAKPYSIGLITILTGNYSDFGRASASAAQLAVEDYEAANPAAKVKLIVEDDGADPKKGLSAFQKLRSADHADMIIPISTFGIGAVHTIVNREKRLTFILGNEPYEPEDDYIYMLSPAAIPAEQALGKYAAAQNPGGKIAIIASQNEVFFRFAQAVKSGAGSQGEIIEIPSGLTDYRGVVTALKAKHPAAVVFNGLPTECAQILKSMRDLGMKPRLYFDESISNSLSDFKAVLGDISFLLDAGFMKMAAHSDPGFIERYTKRFNSPPAQWSDYAYDVVALALKLKDMSSDDARRWLAAHTYRGVSGDIAFDQKGLRIPEFSIGRLGDDPRFSK
jgi:branched-chain amino acid transport system substrate-binding protein